jgi:hypothetical protein
MAVPNQNKSGQIEQSMNWYIKVRDLVYGPYSLERMRHFATEGRLSLTTQVSDNRDTGFHPAAEDALLQEGLTEARLVHSMAPSAGIRQPQSQMRQFLLHMKITGATRPALLARLARFGTPIEPVPGVFVLKAATTDNEIRNVLSRDFGSEDQLLVFEVSGEHSAWFNIGETADRQIRQYLSRGK